MTRFIRFGAVAALSMTAGALAHNHMTIDTVAGQKGDQILITVGYLDNESDWSIDERGRLLHKGEISVYELASTIEVEGPLHGWLAGDPLVLTSDYFVGTGRLDGGDFQFEIVRIIEVAAHEPDYVLGVSHDGELHVRARATGATREERSFGVGAGGHEHGQFMAIEAGGLFDVVLRAWDANGRYADSADVTFRLRTNACAGDVTDDGRVDFDDLLAVLDAWGPCNDCPADTNHDGMVDFDDLLAVLDGWGDCA